MRLEEIADLLADYRETKERQKVLKEDMVRVAVEELGMDQQEAIRKADQLYVFLDGYLVGQGVQQSWRNMK
jgi:hypothetical protein